jgi:thiol peroxidase
VAEKKRHSTFGGDPVTLSGPELRPGDRAPHFDLVGVDGSAVSLASSRGKTRIVLSILSVDTNVCHAEIREIARRTVEMDGVEVLVVSTDLPFAMKRWLEAAGVENVTMASDHREASFGLAWGTLVEGRRVLSRAAFVVSPDDEITYAEYVPEIGDQPDFDAVLDAARATSVSASTAPSRSRSRPARSSRG